jgi:hypothetical protein
MNIRDKVVDKHYWAFINRAGAVVIMPIKRAAFEKQCKSPGFARTSLLVGDVQHHITYGKPASEQLALKGLSDLFFNDLPGAGADVPF